ncbi:MAG: CTP synthase [Candidatus Yanofskybacteria bacterium]|nr:CTP synthase [Candidatus Yanofskybacteria bacterium]
METKFIFVAGGVMSGVGKGVAVASIAKILQARGLETTAVKIDPYVNVDAGTMNPTEHGEVFVLDDGMECDQDMGNYERFLGRNLSSKNYMTTGSIYLDVINRERNLDYGGKCVEVVPQIPLFIIEKIKRAAKTNRAKVVIVEIGGTVGEYQNILFLEAVRMLKIKQPDDVALVLVSMLPVLEAGGTELKTKPTQYAVRTLNAAGLQPDIILARGSVPVDDSRKEKLALNCNLRREDIISAPNVKNIYEIPLNFEKDRLSDLLLKKLKLKAKKKDFRKWKKFIHKSNNPTKKVRIGIVGKYFNSGDFVLTDSYLSVLEAVKHAAWSLRADPEITWLNAESYENNPTSLEELKNFDGIIVPGGFGKRGVEGKIAAIKYVRENNIPFLGLCYGLQLAVVEFARDICGLKEAHTTEIDPETPKPVICTMPDQLVNIKKKQMGGSMRLGAYKCKLHPKSISYKLYTTSHPSTLLGTGKLTPNLLTPNFLISERHRHRYEVNNHYRLKLEKGGMLIAGLNPQRELIEIIEIPEHKFFVATQFHPEFKSRPLSPHPLFVGLIKAASEIK